MTKKQAHELWFLCEGATRNWTSPWNMGFALRARTDLPAALDMLWGAMDELQRLYDGGLRSEKTRDLLAEWRGEQCGSTVQNAKPPELMRKN